LILWKIDALGARMSDGSQTYKGRHEVIVKQHSWRLDGIRNGTRTAQMVARIGVSRPRSLLLQMARSAGGWTRAHSLLLNYDHVRLHEPAELRIQHVQRKQQLLTRSVRDHLLCDLKHAHRAKVDGNVRLGVISATDGGQNRLDKL
jgi:hypothetical protein